MLEQEVAVEKICGSLRQDPLVKAVFLKGSMGRGEHDAHSDIDLYCLVDGKDEADFLKRRMDHLEAYREIVFYDDIHIIAPQLIAVFDNMLHLDLFTVTRETFPEKDYMKVLYDPDHELVAFTGMQGLEIKQDELDDDITDIAWFLFQYRKAADRGNHIWAVRMLGNVMQHLTRVLLHKHSPDRAQLGLKTLGRSLPPAVLQDVEDIFEYITPSHHETASLKIRQMVRREKDWLLSNTSIRPRIEFLLKEMIK